MDQGRNRSKLLDQARRQTAVVGDVLAAAGLWVVPVRPALCFLGVEWPLLFTPRSAGEVALVSPRRLSSLSTGAPTLSADLIEQVAGVLDRELRPATSVTTGDSTSPPKSKAVASSQSQPLEPSPGLHNDVTVKRWKRYGKDRLYVNGRDGATLGYVDLQTNAVVPTEERFRGTVSDAVARHPPEA